METTIIILSTSLVLSILFLRYLLLQKHLKKITRRGDTTPYGINIFNGDDETKNVALFGMYTHLLTAGFGSDKGLSVQPVAENVSYLELLQQSASQPFETERIEIYGSEIQVKQAWTITSKCANGMMVQIPIITQSYYDYNQVKQESKECKLVLNYPIKIDGGASIEFSVLPNENVKIFLYGSTVRYAVTNHLEYLSNKLKSFFGIELEIPELHGLRNH